MKIIFPSVIALIIVMTSCGGKKEKKHTDIPLAKVEVLEVKLEPIPVKMKFSGKVESINRTVLSTKILGQVEYLNVDEGGRVEKGDVLLRIRSKDIKARYAAAEAELQEALSTFQNVKKNYERISKLHKNGSATQKELDDIKTQYDVLRAKVSAARQHKAQVEEQLDYAVIRSPFDGSVTEKFIQVGDMAAPGSPLIAVESPSSFKVIVKIPEYAIDMLNMGEAVVINPDIADTKTINGKISAINPSSHFTGAQFEVTVILDPDADKHGVRPGMYAEMILEKNDTKGILIPTEALYTRGQLKGVFTINHRNETMLRWIRTGNSFGSKVEVLSGLTEGEKYIVSSRERIKDGQKVEIIN